MRFFSRAFHGLAKAVLGLDDTAVPRDQVRMLSDFLWRYKFDMSSEDSKELLKVLERKHLVDNISVSTASGSLIVSSSGNGESAREALTGSALYNFVASEFPKSESILVKSNGSWFMVYRSNQRLYLVRAGASLSTVELSALAKEVEGFLSRKSNNCNSLFPSEKAWGKTPAGNGLFSVLKTNGFRNAESSDSAAEKIPGKSPGGNGKHAGKELNSGEIN